MPPETNKEALAVARGLCSAVDHNEGKYPKGYDERPCTCSAITAALESFAAGEIERVISNDKAIQNIAKGYASQLKGAATDNDALRERNGALVEALNGMMSVKRGNDGNPCWCYTDLVDGHDPRCRKVRAALAADAKAGEDAHAGN